MKMKNKKNAPEKEEELRAQEQTMEQEDIEKSTASTDENPEPHEVKTGVGEIEKLKEELQDASDKYLRKVAEFENFRKRTAKEKMDLQEFGSEGVVKSILEVLDDTDRAEQQFDKETDVESLKTGVLLIFNKLRGILKKEGVSQMECLGAEFDPDLHEALAQIPAASEEQKGKIVDVLKPGYYLNGRIIRHAQVVVGK